MTKKTDSNSHFKRSSACGIGACVEVKIHTPPKEVLIANGWQDFYEEHSVSIRNSKDPEKEISFTLNEWKLFVRGVKNGEFDV